MIHSPQPKSRNKWWPYAAITILVIIFCWRVCIGLKVFSGADLLLKAYYPWHASEYAITDSPPENPEISDPVFSFVPNIMFCLESIKKGIVPLWNPLKMCGMPQLADGTTPIFFPLNVLYFLGMHPLAAGTIKIIIELILFGIFCYLFGKEIGLNNAGALAAAVIVLFCTRTIAWLEFYMFLDSRMWYPAILLCYERFIGRKKSGYLLLGSIFFGLCVLSLSPKDIVYFVQFLFVYILFRSFQKRKEGGLFMRFVRSSLFMFIIALFGIGLGAIQVLPLMEFSHHCGRTPATLRLIPIPEFFISVKNALFSDQLWYMHFDAHWRLISLVSFILPKFFGAAHDLMLFTVNPYAEHINYIGILPFILVIAATITLRKNRTVLFFALTGIISYLLWANTPILMQIYDALSLGAMAGKGALRLKFIMSFCFAYIAGIAITQVSLNNPDRKKLVKSAEIISYIFILIGLLLITYESIGHNQFYNLIKTTQFFGVDDRLKAGVSEALINLPAQKSFIGYQLFNAGLFLLMSVLGLVFLRLCRRKNTSGPLCGGFAVAVIFLDLFIFGHDYNPAIALRLAYPATKTTSFLQADKSLYRLYRFGSNDPLTAGAVNAYAISDAGGRAMSLYSRRSAELLELIVPASEFKSYLSPSYFCSMEGFRSRLLDILNIKYIASLDSISAFGPQSNDRIAFDFVEGFQSATIQSPGEKFVAIDRFAINGVAKRVILENPPSKARYALSLPMNASLVFSIGMNPQSWQEDQRNKLFDAVKRFIRRRPPVRSDGMIFKVEAGDDAGQKVIFKKALDPVGNKSDRKWHEYAIPLHEYAGKDITLSFITEPGRHNDSRCDWGGWAHPMIIDGSPPFAAPAAADQKFQPVWSDEGIYLYENKKVLPRAFIAFNSKVIIDDRILKEKIRTMHLDNEDYVYLSSGKEIGYHKPFSTKANIIDYSPNTVRIKASLDSEGYLVLADSFYPGWEASVDGREAEILRAFYNLRAVLLVPGEHDVLFQYRPQSFIKGRNITVFSAVLLLVWALGYFILKKKRPK